MKVSRMVVLCAAMCVVGAAVAGAQGRGATQRPAKPATPATHAPRGPQGPKAAGTTGRQNDRPKPAQAARGAEKSDAAKSGENRGAGDRSIAANIAKSPQLEARLSAMLPSGMSMEQAAEGFRNQGQFIAALEASKNQNIDFVKLKAEMTGDDAVSLGQAVQKLKPAEAQ